MAQHKVIMELPPKPIGKADAVFKVKQNGKLFGTLTVSKGSLVWFPRSNSYGHKIGWARFAQLMEEQAPRFEKR